MRYILILLLALSTKSFFQPNLTFPELHEKYIGNLFKVYKNFTFVFHVENSSFDHIYSVYELYKKNVHQEMYIYNYDCDGRENIIRQFGSRFLNLVVMNNIFKFERFSKEPGRMAVNDVVLLFLYGNYNDKEIEKWTIMGQHRIIGNILILDLMIPNRVTLNSTIFYTVKGTKIRDILQSTNSTQVKVPLNLLLPKDFENLNGCLLHVGYVDYFPYIYCLEYENFTLRLGPDEVKVCKRAVGAEAELLRVLAVRMNFTYNLVNYPGKLHAYIFNKVVERKVDFVVGGITRTYNRVLNATFTISHITEGYTFLYIYHVGQLSYLLMFFYPFQWQLWLFIIFTVALLGSLTYIIVNYDSNVTKSKISVYKSAIMGVNAIIEQVVDLDPKFFRQKHILYVLHIIWWFTCIWLTTIYRGKLSSIYVNPPHREPTSLQRIVEDDYKIVVDEIQADTIGELYQYQTDNAMQKAVQSTIFITGLCNVINYTLTHKVAMLHEFGVVKYHCQIRCPNLIGPRKNLSYDHGSLRIVAKPLVIIPHGWPLPKGTPFTLTINMYKLRLRDAGCIEQWIRLSEATGEIWSIRAAQDNSAIRRSDDQVSVILYLSAFLLLVVGYITSITVFIIELQVSRRKKRNFHFSKKFNKHRK